ncbi:anthrax toxin receptor-like [Lepus europaeus]|uniref:anthrax toxin receptor-like n=1 Tax=Lepus europaeus TaxID=9983 RepID=UPI002B4657EE|nr:anthrax toxin receptor-like [Lepus europaeus]
MTVCPTVIVCCCACQGVWVSRVSQGTVDGFYNYIQPSCHPSPMMLCRARGQERWPDLALMKAPSTSSLCLQPSLESLPLTWCPQCHHLPDRCTRPSTRMLPLPAPQNPALCRSTLSLPPL